MPTSSPARSGVAERPSRGPKSVSSSSVRFVGEPRRWTSSATRNRCGPCVTPVRNASERAVCIVASTTRRPSGAVQSRRTSRQAPKPAPTLRMRALDGPTADWISSNHWANKVLSGTTTIGTSSNFVRDSRMASRAVKVFPAPVANARMPRPDGA